MNNIIEYDKEGDPKPLCGPRILAQCSNAFPTRMASSIFFIWKFDFYWLFENDLESPLIFVLFLKGKQNKKEKP